MTSLKSQPSSDRTGRLGGGGWKSVWRKISPSRGSPSRATSLSKDDDHDQFHRSIDKQDPKGERGLILLHDPPNPKIDFIFVHGLGGGSRKTWASSTDPQQYWPKAWLPQDIEFSSVRIHSFGYNADWNEWSTNEHIILDFARFLLHGTSNDPKIRKSETKIVFIGHSMGGIIIKKAYMLAREDVALRSFATRVHTLYFLATPHRGADYSKALGRILAISYGKKSYVPELSRDSPTIASINESFRHYAGDVQLWSFYETHPARIFGIQVMIVDNGSAIFGSPHEIITPLDADHSGVCKFQSEHDPNYRTVRNSFVTSIDKILKDDLTTMSRAEALELEQLVQLSGISELPEEELLAREDIQTPETCEWLIKRAIYTSWQGPPNGNRPFFWLTGNAGAGKSILCNHIALHLQFQEFKCSHFFFKNGYSQKSSLAMCLRSLANQMARADSSILRELLEVHSSSSSWENWDDKALWRKLFLDHIFKVTSQHVHYWVIDSVDECKKSLSFLGYLVNVPPWLKVFFTSRSSLYNAENVSELTGRLEHYHIQNADTIADFKLFIDKKLAHVPASCEKNRENLKQRILDKASGSFLWVSLVMSILAKAYSEEAAEEILEEVPTDMNSLYNDMLGDVLQDHHAVVLAKSLYSWALFSSRPLKIDGLQAVLKLDTNQTVLNLDGLIPAISGQLMTMNQHHEVEVIHQTAKSYLLDQKKHLDLVLDKEQCHTDMAQICLGILAGVPTKRQLAWRPPQNAKSSLLPTAPDLVDYAYEHFSDHLRWSSTENEDNWELLCKFLDCNILAWIEFLAKKRHMRSVTRTAQNLRLYFGHRVKHLSPISPQKANMERWIYDLFRLSAKFGASLTLSPSSVRHLIPSMCPSESNISKYKTDSLSHVKFSVKGILENSWDDCLSRTDYPNHQTSAVACGEQYSAVALTSGSIYLYFQASGQLKSTLDHCARANILLFSTEDRYLVSSGQRKVKVWDPAEGVLLWQFENKHQILNLSFSKDKFTLTGASQGSYILEWDLNTGQEHDKWQWVDSVRTVGDVQKSLPQPSKAVFSQDHKFLAVNYRGLPLHLFDPLSKKFVGVYSRECETGLTGAVNVEAFAFHPSPEINILIVSYADGELVVYDINSKQLRYRRPNVFAHCLKCSPYSRTLITGSSKGAIRIFEFAGASGDQLLPLYTINAQDDGIRDIATSSESVRFADIRGSQYRVWEPAVLSCTDMDEGSQSELSLPASMEMQPVGLLDSQSEPEITAIHCHPSGNFVFCGNRDGSVSYYETRTVKRRQVLFRHASDICITYILYIEHKRLLVTADESGRVLINKLTESDAGIDFYCYVNEIRSEQPLSLLLHDFSGTRILLRGKKRTEIWTTEGHNLGLKLIDDGEALLSNHPLHPGFLIAFSHQATSIFSWEDGRNTTPCLHGKQEVDLTVTPPTPSHGQSEERLIQCEEPWKAPYLVNLRRHDLRDNADMIYIWPVSSVIDSTSIAPSIPLGNFGSQAHRVRQIIAMAGNVLYFLDTDLWICSLDITNKSTIYSGAKRHCFLLSEWRNVDGGFLVEYVPTTREFVVSKKNELLVISGGLDFEEPWI